MDFTLDEWRRLRKEDPFEAMKYRREWEEKRDRARASERYFQRRQREKSYAELVAEGVYVRTAWRTHSIYIDKDISLTLSFQICRDGSWKEKVGWTTRRK
jgi:hypothetical protein